MKQNKTNNLSTDQSQPVKIHALVDHQWRQILGNSSTLETHLNLQLLINTLIHIMFDIFLQFCMMTLELTGHIEY